MLTFEQWNDAIIRYFTDGEKEGAAIFLDISEERLTEIGLAYLSEESPPPPNWADDFKVAVRSKCTGLASNGQREVRLYRIPRFNSEQAGNKPSGVAFLALMALAAHNMAEDEEAADHNYFTRLRQLLNISGNKRPPGMPAGDEERLWKEWERWLTREGFTVTARQGSGSQQYISYPLSQPLLRRADRERLFAWFKEHNYQAGLDQARLGGRLRRNVRYIGGKHLREVLGDSGVQRLEAINLVLFEVYQDWLEAGRPAKLFLHRSAASGLHRTTASSLVAGLYREVGDVFSGQVDYYLYPPQPRRVRVSGTPAVLHQGDRIELETERGGWYWPLWDWPLNAKTLDEGVKYELEGVSQLDHLILPAREFWLLVPDPNCPTNNLYATWQDNADLGTPFILLCKDELSAQIEQLRKDERLTWQGQPRPLAKLPGWLEYVGVQVISENWAGATIENKDLFEALRPKTSLGLVVTGGVRLVERDSWLEGCEPQITIVAFAEKASLEVRLVNPQSVTTLPQSTVLHSMTELGNVLNLSGKVDLGEVDTNKPIKIEWPGMGEYIVEANCGADFIEKTIIIRAWQDLELPSIEPQAQMGLRIGSARLLGPLVEETSLI